MRYFISVDVSDEDVKDSLVNFMDEIKGYGDIKTVRPENLHLTLLFLGERSQSDLDEVRNNFITSCEAIDLGEFECNVTDLGVFPHMNYIKVVWAGAEPAEKFHDLHMNFSEYMSGEDEGNFVPHITVGRVRGIGSDEKERLKEVIERHPADFGGFQVENVRLKESELGEGGPTYRDIEVYSL